MERFIIDSELASHLEQKTGEIELCLPDGRVVGVFTSQTERLAELRRKNPLTMTREEMDRRYNEPGGSSLAEIWQRLGVK